MNEIRKIYERAQELAENDYPKGPLVKFLTMILLATFIFVVSIIVYGMYNFPDAPLSLKGTGYVGKTGKPHTMAEFENFLLWEKMMFISFSSVFATGFALTLAETRDRRRYKMNGEI
jgi:hypothetical protein